MNISEQLGLKLPIFQAPLELYPNQTALVAKVSDCGGLGIYSANHQSLSAIDKALKDIKMRTDKPFAVMIDVTDTEKALDLADRSSANLYLADAYKILNIKETEAEPLPRFHDVVRSVLAHQPAVMIFQNGLPTNEVIQACKHHNVVTMAIASNVLEAVAIDNAKLDAVVLQGMESAGMQSQFANDLNAPRYPINTLLTQTESLVNMPVIAWGDYQTSSNIVAALVNGVSAVMLDTPFWTTNESPIPNSYRQALLAHNEMAITTTSLWQGHPSQVMKNHLTQKIKSVNTKPLLAKQQQRLMLPIIAAAVAQNNSDYLPLWAGYCVTSSKKTVSELCEKFSAELNDIIE